MTLLEMELLPIDSAAVRDRDWPTARDRDWPTAPIAPAAPAAPTPAALSPDVHDSVLTLVTVAVRVTGDAEAEPEEDAEEFDELAAARFQLSPLPRLSDLVLTVVQTDSSGTIQRWTGPAAAGAGIPTGPGAVLHLQPAASHHVAADARNLAIQADRDRRPSRAG